MARFMVEDCLCFDAVVLRRRGFFTSHFGTEGTYQWGRAGSGLDRSLSCTVVEMPAVAMGLRLDYVVTDARSKTKHPMQYVVEVTSTPCRFGGRGFLLRCLLLRNGVPCEQRVRQLYLPPGGQMFGCRHCYNLTYASCQHHDQRVDDLARDPFALKIALQSPSLKRQMLGVRAYTRLVWWMNRYGRLPQRRRRYSASSQAPNRCGSHDTQAESL
jgi:hypothetical protein